MVPRRLYPWNIALLVLFGLHAPAANRGTDSVHRQCAQ